MLKIDLLPAYVRERQKVRSVLVAFGILLAVEFAGIFAYHSARSKVMAEWDKKISDVEPGVSKANTLDSEIQVEQGKLPPVETLVNFYKDAIDTTPQSIKVYHDIAAYTYNRAQLLGVQLNATTATITGRIHGVDALGQFVLNFMRCPAFSAVQFQADLQSFNFGGGGGQTGGGGGPMGGGAPGMGMGPGAGPAGAGPAGGMGQAGQQAQVTSVGGPAGFISLPTQEMHFTLTCTLAKPFKIPGAQAAAAAGPGGPMGGGGMGGPGGPGGPAVGPPGGKGGPAPPGAKGRGKGAAEEGGGGGLARRGKGGED